MNRQQRRAHGHVAPASAGPAAALLTEAVRQHRAGRSAEAEALYRRILRADGRHAVALHLLGVLVHQLGRHDEAVALIDQAIALDRTRAEFHYNLGNAQAALGRLDEATRCFRAVLALQPDHVSACSNLGSILTTLGQPEDGIACFRKAVAVQPDRADGHYNLGNALARQWRLDQAIRSLRRSVALRPDADACNTLGNALRDCGRIEDACAAFDDALRLRPDDFALRSNRLLAENYRLGGTPDAMSAMAAAFGALAASRVPHPFTGRDPGSASGPIRVGLVSGDLRNHPVGYFLEGLLEAADPERITFLAFPTGTAEDELTARIRRRVATWQPIAGLDDEAAARSIRATGVQILLDLSGHTAGNRLPVFCWRPAPVQASWLGYFATTGLAEIDYVIADPQVSPPGASGEFVEQVWPLPDIYYCFTPPAVTVEVSPLPARSTGSITFGCFNTLAKINDVVIATWARVLRAVPDSRLVLKAPPLGEAAACAALRARFAAHGIAGERLLLEQASSRAEYLRAHHRIDVALDPFPFPGGTTTFEALWMGVPVLTRTGDRFLSRVGETIMRNAGLPDWVAEDEDDYIDTAVRLTADLDRLARLRHDLRVRVLASPLFDASRFARQFEDAMSGIWARRLAPGSASAPGRYDAPR